MRLLNSKSGFSLVEVAFGLAIAVFCLVVIMALLPVGLTTGRATTGETAANGILNAVASDLRATAPTGTATSEFQIPVPANGSASTSSSSAAPLYFTAQGVSTGTVLTASALYKLSLTFTATTGNRAATIAIAKVTWPAASATPTGSAESFIAIDRN